MKFLSVLICSLFLTSSLYAKTIATSHPNLRKNLLVSANIATAKGGLPIRGLLTQPFVKEDYPVFNLKLDTSRASTAEEIRVVIEKNLVEAAASIQDPWMGPQVRELLDFVLAGKLSSVNQKVSSDVWAYTALKDTIYGIRGSAFIWVGRIGAPTSPLFYQFFVSNKFEPSILRRLRSTMHEVLGHLPHFMTIQSKFGAAGLEAQLGDPTFSDPFYKFTHFATAVNEWQFYQAVPKSFLIDEINASTVSQADKDAAIRYTDKIYAMTLRDFVKNNTRLEACGGKDCYSEAEYDALFEHFRALGFVL